MNVWPGSTWKWKSESAEGRQTSRGCLFLWRHVYRETNTPIFCALVSSGFFFFFLYRLLPGHFFFFILPAIGTCFTLTEKTCLSALEKKFSEKISYCLFLYNKIIIFAMYHALFLTGYRHGVIDFLRKQVASCQLSPKLSGQKETAMDPIHFCSWHHILGIHRFPGEYRCEVCCTLVSLKPLPQILINIQ